MNTENDDSSLAQERAEILEEARTLTLSLYRICVRSVRLIRQGNEHDEQEFVKREQERLEAPIGSDSPGQSFLSLLPPVNRVDELRSRAEYYMQYTHENFVQESDCLDFREWDTQHFSRYLYHLRRGDEHRQWLLKDMKFPDPYKGALDKDRVDRFEAKAMRHMEKLEARKESLLPPRIREQLLRQRANQEKKKQGAGSNEEDDDDDDDDDDDGFWSDDEEFEESTLPHWYRNPRRGRH